MPRSSFSIPALLAAWVALTAAQPASITWNLASPDHLLRIVRVVSASEKPPELGADWPAIPSLVALEGERQAWIWEVSRDAIPSAKHFDLQGTPFEAPFPDVICFGCSEADRKALAPVIGTPSSSDQDTDGILPHSPITLVISDAQVYPNPFNPFQDDAVISVTLGDNADVHVIAYDWNGEYVATVFKGPWLTGVNTTLWSGQTEDGRKLGNGVYLLRITAQSGTRQEQHILKVAVWNER